MRYLPSRVHRVKRLCIPFCAVVFQLLLFGDCPLGSADVIHLKNGQVLEGIIVEEGSNMVMIEVAFGKIAVTPAQIDSIQRESDAEDQLRLGKSLLKQGQAGRAEACLQKALQIHPGLSEAAGTLDEAHSQILLKTLESRLSVLRNLTEQEKYSKAIEGYRSLLREVRAEGARRVLTRELAGVHADYAFFLYNHLYEDRALEEIRAAQAVGGDFAQLHFILGRLAEVSGHDEDAIWEYEEALRQQPGHARAKTALNQIRLRRPRLFEKPPVREIPQEPKPPRRPLPRPRRPQRLVPAPSDIASAVRHFATQKGFDPDFIETIIRIESSFDPNAISEADCRGLMQLGKGAWDDTVRRLGRSWDFESNVHDPVKNIEVGTEYLRWMRDEYFPKYRSELAGTPIEEILIQGYHSGPWRTVVYRGNVPGPRMAQYRERYSRYRNTVVIR